MTELASPAQRVTWFDSDPDRPVGTVYVRPRPVFLHRVGALTWLGLSIGAGWAAAYWVTEEITRWRWARRLARLNANGGRS